MISADERWHAALDAVGATRGDRDAVFTAVVEHYGEPDRHHHTYRHASAVVDTILTLHDPGDDWATTVLAGWFHDVIYDPRAGAGVNEGASAVAATRWLTDLGATLSQIGEVARLVCLTADHRPVVGDRTGALLTDADLSVLGASEADYDCYVQGVRAEYAHVSEDDWRLGRPAVLRSFLDRTTIFRTEAGRERWEQPARTNISREIEALRR